MSASNYGGFLKSVDHKTDRVLNMKKVVVVGGSGFLGSHTADELSRRGYDVVIFDSVKSRWLRDDQEMIIGDIMDRDAVRNALEAATAVYHFAGISDINEATEKPFNTVKVNVLGTANILESVCELKVKRFMYASTLYVYSSYGSFYRATKQSSETLIEAYQEINQFDYTFMRYGSLYGPRAQDWNGIRRYVEDIIRNGQLVYDGTGRERREYIHVNDAARLSADVITQDFVNQAVTITGSQVLTSRELIDLIFEIAGLEENARYMPEEKAGYHYSSTPYRYTPKQAKKLVPREFIDIGEGVLEIIEEISRDVHRERNPG
jgi:UDP-glucose 4-epimerase